MRITRPVAILISTMCVPLVSRAADAQVTSSTQSRSTQVEVTSSTQFLWYQDYLSPNKDQYDAAELLRLNVTNIDGQNKLNFYSYGRLIRQFSSTNEERPQQPFNTTYNGRFYYGYLEYRDLIQDHLDVRAGRTYVPAAALPATIDGLYLNARNLVLPGLGATVFGGRRVLFDNKGEIGTIYDTSWGGSVYFDTLKLTHLEASYGRQYAGFPNASQTLGLPIITGGTNAGSYLSQENVALTLSTVPIDMLRVEGRAKYDLASNRWSELLIGLNLTPIKELAVLADYYASYPTFDQFSFYHFFNVNQYQQVSGTVEVRLLDEKLRIHGRYAHEDFGDNGTAELFETGLVLRPITDLTIDASFERRFGYAGELSGLRGFVSYRISKALLLAGADYDDFGRQDSGSGTAKKYYAGFNLDLSKAFSLVVRAENNLNFYFSHAYQGFAALNINI